MGARACCEPKTTEKHTNGHYYFKTCCRDFTSDTEATRITKQAEEVHEITGRHIQIFFNKRINKYNKYHTGKALMLVHP